VDHLPRLETTAPHLGNACSGIVAFFHMSHPTISIDNRRRGRSGCRYRWLQPIEIILPKLSVVSRNDALSVWKRFAV
jgi:hypothetical protein